LEIESKQVLSDQKSTMGNWAVSRLGGLIGLKTSYWTCEKNPFKCLISPSTYFSKSETKRITSLSKAENSF
jgi:hypothetical protein